MGDPGGQTPDRRHLLRMDHLRLSSAEVANSVLQLQRPLRDLLLEALVQCHDLVMLLRHLLHQPEQACGQVGSDDRGTDEQEERVQPDGARNARNGGEQHDQQRVARRRREDEVEASDR